MRAGDEEHGAGPMIDVGSTLLRLALESVMNNRSSFFNGFCRGLLGLGFALRGLRQVAFPDGAGGTIVGRNGEAAIVIVGRRG